MTLNQDEPESPNSSLFSYFKWFNFFPQIIEWIGGFNKAS